MSVNEPAVTAVKVQVVAKEGKINWSDPRWDAPSPGEVLWSETVTDREGLYRAVATAQKWIHEERLSAEVVCHAVPAKTGQGQEA